MTIEPESNDTTEISETPCSICHGEDEENVIKTKCKHRFHLDCLFQWNSRQNMNRTDTTCPECREIIFKYPLTGVSKLIDLQHLQAPAESNETIFNNLLDLLRDEHNSEFEHLLVRNRHLIDFTLQNGVTLLQHSIFCKNWPIMDLLLTHTANIRLQNTYGMNALMIAIESSDLDCIRKIIGKRQCDVESVDSNGETALFYAVKNFDMKAIHLLLQKSANVNHTDKTGSTIFHFVAFGGFGSRLMNVFKNKHPTCLGQQDYSGDTCWHIAFRNGNIKFLQVFKDYITAEVLNTCDYSGCSVSDYLDENDSEDDVEQQMILEFVNTHIRFE